MHSRLWRPIGRSASLLAILTVCAIQCTPNQMQAQISNAAEQIVEAVQAAPAEFQEGARVLGFAPDGAMAELRPGSNQMVCISDNPTLERWSVACYHASLDPFMKMGRDLRAEGTTDSAEIQRLRFGAADSGELSMPERPAALYVATGDGFDSETGEIINGYTRYVLYTPYATAEETGLATRPTGPMQPWLMFPGTAGAHVMISPPRGD